MCTSTRLVESNDVIRLRKDALIGNQRACCKSHLIPSILEEKIVLDDDGGRSTHRTMENGDVCRCFEKERTDLLAKTQQIDQTWRTFLVGQRQIDHSIVKRFFAIGHRSTCVIQGEQHVTLTMFRIEKIANQFRRLSTRQVRRIVSRLETCNPTLPYPSGRVPTRVG